MQVMVRGWLFQQQQPPTEAMSPAALDAWEARPLIPSAAEDTRALQEAGADTAAEEVEHEMASAHR
jgi:hypothetical protein